MPQVTAIEPQKSKRGQSASGGKKTKRFNVYIDDRFAFGVSDINLLKHNLTVGKMLTEEEIAKIVAREELSKLTDLATNFLSFRPRSEKEVYDHLTKKIAKRESIKFHQAQESPLIAKVIDKLKKYKYINDLEFTKWYVDSRKRASPRGQILISLELKRKGVADEIIKNLLATSTNEIELAKVALQKKIKRWQKLSPLDLKKKVYQYLAFRGFNFETIKEVFALVSKKR